MPEVNVSKYNDRIKALEKLRQEAQKDLYDLEDEMGIVDQSQELERNSLEGFSPPGIKEKGYLQNEKRMVGH